MNWPPITSWRFCNPFASSCLSFDFSWTISAWSALSLSPEALAAIFSRFCILTTCSWIKESFSLFNSATWPTAKGAPIVFWINSASVATSDPPKNLMSLWRIDCSIVAPSLSTSNCSFLMLSILILNWLRLTFSCSIWAAACWPDDETPAIIVGLESICSYLWSKISPDVIAALVLSTITPILLLTCSALL